jgi:hypothetical protein
LETSLEIALKPSLEIALMIALEITLEIALKKPYLFSAFSQITFNYVLKQLLTNNDSILM